MQGNLVVVPCTHKTDFEPTAAPSGSISGTGASQVCCPAGS